MDESIEITIEYVGHIKIITKKKTEKLIVSTNLKMGIAEVTNHLEEKYLIKNGFNVMINNQNIIKVMNSNQQWLNPTDVFYVIPIASGG